MRTSWPLLQEDEDENSAPADLLAAEVPLSSKQTPQSLPPKKCCLESIATSVTSLPKKNEANYLAIEHAK